MHSPLMQFEIKPIIPLFLAGKDVSFTNASLFMLLTSFTVVLFFALATQGNRIIPTRLQMAAELSYQFIASMVKESIGPEGKPFFPFLFSLFFFILTGNLWGMMPYSFTFTSHIIVTFVLGVVVFSVVLLVGFWRHGLHFLSLFAPEGVPWLISPFIIVIELFSFLSRPFTLAIRLAANMTAGHVLLKVLASFVMVMGAMWKWVPLPFMMILTGFELFVAILQAYIFAVLTCVYLTDALHMH